MEKKLLQIRIDVALWEKIKSAAVSDSRSVNNLVLNLIQRYIKLREDKPNADV